MAKGLVSTGEVFNNWTVISEAQRDTKRAQQFLCKCICGTERVVKKCNLGNVTGCGCARASPKPYKARAAKAKPLALPKNNIVLKGDTKPPKNTSPRPEYKERRKSTRERIEERQEQVRLSRLLEDEWAL